MSNRPSQFAELLLLCGKVRDDALSPGDAARLDALLRGDDQAKALYVRYMSILSLLESRGVSQPAPGEGSAISEQANQTVLAELLALERVADAELVEQPEVLYLEVPQNKTTWFHGTRRWLEKNAVSAAALAAALAAAFVLIAIWIGGREPMPMALDPYTPDEEAKQVHVATLTAQHDAKWLGLDLLVGDSFKPGQHLNLRAGFAEITTSRGAVARLQSPCTIEFIEDPNAIRLHYGKLVGICDTVASKGFVVRTPQMHVTDLGTRFGVDASNESSFVYVFEGEILAAHPHAPADAEPMMLTVDQSAQASADNKTVHRVDPQAERFATLQPAPIQLTGTGQGLSIDQLDPNWLVMSEDGKPLEQPALMTVVQNKSYPVIRDHPGDSLEPSWLQYLPTIQPTAQQIKVVHLIQSGFELDKHLDPQTTRLAITCGADNTLIAIHLNGKRITELGTKLNRLHDITIDKHLVAGHNTVVFELENTWQQDGQNPIGLYVRWHLLPERTEQSEIKASKEAVEIE